MCLAKISDCLSDPVYGKSFQVLFYSMLWAEEDPNSSFFAGVISLKNTASGTMLLELGTGRKKRTELATKDLESFEKDLEKLVVEIYTPEIAFTKAT